MGANTSKTVNEVVNESVTDMSTRIMDNKQMYTDVRLNASQTQDVTIKSNAACPITITQDMSLVNRVYSSIDQEMQNKLANDYIGKLKSTVENKVKQKNEQLNLGQFNTTIIDNYTRNYDFADMSIKMVNSLANAVNSQIIANQNQKVSLEIGGIENNEGTPNCRIAIGQNLDIDSAIENVLESEQIQDIKNKVTKDLEAETVNEVSQTNVGINPLMFLLFLLIIPIGILVVLGLVVKGIIPSPSMWFKGSSSKV